MNMCVCVCVCVRVCEYTCVYACMCVRDYMCNEFLLSDTGMRYTGSTT